MYNVKTKSNGFSLIEVMIVLAIIGILSAVSYPSYQKYVQKGSRADAKSALVGLSQQMERHFASNGTYLTTITGSAPQPPNMFSSQVPIDGGTARYSLTVQVVTDTSYTLRATPVDAQLGDGYLELLSIGSRRWMEGDETLRNCWESSC